MNFRRIISVVLLVGALSYQSVASGQTPAPAPKAPKPPAAPQVVTIIHRLNGLKMFRLLLRSEQVQSIDALESAFNLTDDVHTNVIAGVAMDDGETIAAWLPEAEFEFGPGVVPLPDFPRPPKAPRVGLLEDPDVQIIAPDGTQVAATYIGLDAATGLSILRLEKKNAIAAGTIKDEPVNTGQTIALFFPGPVTKTRPLLARMGVFRSRIQDVQRAPSGGIARFRVSNPGLSRANVGGVATNLAGDTIGIVDGLEGDVASILPVALIKRAAQRVLE